MIEERKNCSTMMKEHFNKGLLTTIENDEDFENVSVDGDVKVKITVISLKNIKALHIKIVISRLISNFLFHSTV